MTNNTLSLTATQYKDYFDKAISYVQYQENFQAEMALGDESKFAQYLPQNWQRQSRMDRKLKLNAELLGLISQIKEPQKWLVITEHWCGDASQINPIINKVAEASDGKIVLRFIYRDANEPLIDAHLTDGRSRSIPILIVLDEGYSWTKHSYGPRPAEAQDLVKELLSKGESYNIPLHTWYARDKQVSVQRDLIELLKNLSRANN